MWAIVGFIGKKVEKQGRCSGKTKYKRRGEGWKDLVQGKSLLMSTC